VEIFRRQAGRHTLDVIFDYVNFHIYGSISDRLKVQERRPVPQTNFPLVICVRTDPHVGYGELAVTFHTNKLDPARVRKFMEVYRRILSWMTRQPRSSPAECDLLPEADRALLHEWNETAVDHPARQCIHELITERALLVPDAIALADGCQNVSYADLEARANQLAHHLRCLGAGPEVIVGLCVRRSFEMIVGLLGILKSGAAYLPLDPSHPQARLAQMLEEADVPVIVAERELAEGVLAHGARIVLLDDEWAAIAQQPVTVPQSGVQQHNLAYVIYTSGSTGMPKGVLLSHAGLCNLVRGQAAEFGLQTGDRVLQFANLSFDASTWEVATALTAGATLILTAAAHLPIGARLAQTLRDQRVSFAMLPPSALQSLDELHFPDLRLVVVCGESCPPSLARAWASRSRLMNAYGPTEITVAATYGELNAHGGPVHLGWPIANARLYVLNDDLQEVPVGEIGEVHIAGPGVGRGYLRKPGLTAERFVADPFSSAGGRLYRSGDLVRHLPDGSLELIGRVDRQVKLRGFRIEPGEIEAVLLEHPEVDQAVVVAQGADFERTLVGYVVSSDGAAQDVGALRSHLKRRLPEYMVPAVFVFLSQLPVNANGKIDRSALPAPDARPGGAPYVEPRNDLETRLASIWSQVLRVERAGIHDDFLQLGGHSLNATRVIARIRESLGVDLPVKALYEALTIADLAEHIENQRWLQEQVARHRGTEGTAGDG
jgi:amino acid adenylation domain-containing protein